MSRSPSLLDAALSLPIEERAELAHKLLLSLDAPVAPGEEADAAWLAEIERRRAAIRSGQSPVNWNAALEDIRRTLGQPGVK